MDAILRLLTKYIAERILKQPGRELAPDEPLISSGLVDSFSLVDLALFIEDTFGAHIEDTELTAQSIDTLTQLVNLIRLRQSA